MQVNNNQPGGSGPLRKRLAHEESPSTDGAQQSRRARLEAKAGSINHAPLAERKAIQSARPENAERAARNDRLELAHTSDAQQTDPARAARIEALSEDFRSGVLNTRERLEQSARNILLG